MFWFFQFMLLNWLCSLFLGVMLGLLCLVWKMNKNMVWLLCSVNCVSCWLMVLQRIQLCLLWGWQLLIMQVVILQFRQCLKFCFGLKISWCMLECSLLVLMIRLKLCGVVFLKVSWMLLWCLLMVVMLLLKIVFIWFLIVVQIVVVRLLCGKLVKLLLIMW